MGIAFLLAACGGGGEGGQAGDDGTRAPRTESSKTVRIVATDFAFRPETVQIEAPGTYTFLVPNRGKAEHALTIDGGGLEKDTGTIAPGATGRVTVAIEEPGEYEIYCPVGGHRDAGMEGTVTAGAA